MSSPGRYQAGYQQPFPLRPWHIFTNREFARVMKCRLELRPVSMMYCIDKSSPTEYLIFKAWNSWKVPTSLPNARLTSRLVESQLSCWHTKSFVCRHVFLFYFLATSIYCCVNSILWCLIPHLPINNTYVLIVSAFESKGQVASFSPFLCSSATFNVSFILAFLIPFTYFLR